MLNFMSTLFRMFGTFIMIAVVIAAIVFAGWYGGAKRQAYYDSIGHKVYSQEAIKLFKETGNR